MDGSAFSVKLLRYDLTKGVGNGSSTAARYNYQESVVCRSRPPALRFSASAIENLTCAKTLVFDEVWSAKSKGTVSCAFNVIDS
jgi:hypothetical protein